MKEPINFIFFAACVMFLSACGDDTETPKGQYEHGVFVVNEGGFGNANGTVTYVDASLTATQNIAQLNPAKFAGDVAQSLTFDGDRGYLVLNGDNKIEVVDANTFKSINTIASPDLVAPRYVQIVNGKAYISVWGPYNEDFSLVDSYVLVYDLSSGATVNKIDTDEGTENFTYNGKYIFASNYNFGASKSVSVIDPVSNNLVKEIALTTSGPAGSVIDADGKLWVMAVGGYGATSGTLFKINTTTLSVEDSIFVQGQPNVDIALTQDKKGIIYSVVTKVYKLDIDATEAPSSPLFEGTEVSILYSLMTDPSTGNIWIGDALDFASPGKVYVYSPAGTLIKSIDAGISPGQLVFK